MRVITKFLLIIPFLGCLPLLKAQEIDMTHHCGTVIYNRNLQDNSPELKKNHERIQQEIADYIAKYSDNQRDPKTIITVPVVVHVLWNTPEENIPDEQVWSQIFVLNEDYRHLNPDSIHTPAMFKSLAADCGIEFCLARRAPFDTAATSGILRVHTDSLAFYLDNGVKTPFAGGSRAWDPKHYLNIWVCKLVGNYLGYAQYPGGTDSTDGVVIDYRCFGSIGNLNTHYNKGRTATHEIGHWFDLYHIWGDDYGSCDGTDYVDDTPNAADANYYCPTHPRISACNSTGEMFMNYMDYVDDVCFNLFTYGQRDRMLAAIATARPELLESEGCIPYDAIEEVSQNLHLDIYPNPVDEAFTIAFLLPYPAVTVITLTDITGREVYHLQTPKQTEFHVPVVVSQQNNGVYFLKVRAGNFSASSKLVVLH